jgi:hypothetical protein
MPVRLKFQSPHVRYCDPLKSSSSGEVVEPLPMFEGEMPSDSEVKAAVVAVPELSLRDEALLV